jgi:hypothetical protein
MVGCPIRGLSGVSTCSRVMAIVFPKETFLILLSDNQIALQASGLSFILGTRIPFVPDVVREWRLFNFKGAVVISLS